MTPQQLRQIALKCKESWTIENDQALTGVMTPDLVLALLDIVDAAERLVQVGNIRPFAGDARTKVADALEALKSFH